MPRLRLDENYEDYDYNTPGFQPTYPEAPQPGPGAAPPPPPAGGPAPVNPTAWSRPMEDQWINFANSQYGGSASGHDINDIVANYNKTYNTNAKAVGSDKVDFGFGPSDVIKDVGGKNQLWLGDYADPTGASPNSRGGSGGGSGSGGYAAPQSSGSSNSFMGASAPVNDHKNFDEIMANLKTLFPNGGYNQDIVNRRTENARENLLRQRKSTNANDRAALANRGEIGSGPEITALTRADQDMADRYANATSGIYADESANADQRMMQALQTAAGMDAGDASAFINAYKAQTDRGLGSGNLALGQQRADNDFTLGAGNLALGNMNGVNNYNLGLANVGLGRDSLLQKTSQDKINTVLELLKQGMSMDEILTRGYLE